MSKKTTTPPPTETEIKTMEDNALKSLIQEKKESPYQALLRRREELKLLQEQTKNEKGQEQVIK